MNNTVFTFFIFVVTLFLYIHITAQWKTSNDLEIYEADFVSASQLQDVCSVKQPVIFKFDKPGQLTDPTILRFFDKFNPNHFEKYDNIDIRIKDRQDYVTAEKDPAIISVPLSFRSARRLLTTDTNAKYLSEKNETFLEESGLDRLYQPLDNILKPPLNAYIKHDMVIGSPHVTTPFRYHLETHHFIAVTRGKIHVKICPPKYSNVIPHFKDYENYEFWSPLNIESPKYKDVCQRIKILHVDVHPGDILFLPPYWWYSMQFSGDANTTVATLTYDVAMNVLAQSNHWGLYYLQQSNIKKRPAKNIIVSEDGQPPEQEETVSLPERVVDIASSDPVKREIVTNAGIYVTTGEK
jgi:hypothetical protein